jgi:hypothetical protein
MLVHARVGLVERRCTARHRRRCHALWRYAGRHRRPVCRPQGPPRCLPSCVEGGGGGEALKRNPRQETQQARNRFTRAPRTPAVFSTV